MQHLIVIAIMALVPLGARAAMGERMILAPLHRLLSGYGMVSKPLVDCSRCMVSIWGTTAAVLLGVYPLTLWGLICWPVYALAAVGLQQAIDK